MTKVCSPTKGCGLEKDISEFHKKNKAYVHICKSCCFQKDKRYREKNKQKINKQKQRYREKNKQKINKQKQQYYESNKQKILEQRQQYRESNKQKVIERQQQYRENNYEKIMLRASKRRAIEKGWEHNLTIEDIQIPEVCPILGIKLELVTGKKTRSHCSPSLDRIDSNKGYIKENVMVISWRANHLKSDATLEELEKLVEGLKKISLKES